MIKDVRAKEVKEEGEVKERGGRACGKAINR